MTIGLLHPNFSPATRPVLLGCPDCGSPELLLRVETPVPITVTQTAADPFDPDGYTIRRVDHTPPPVLDPPGPSACSAPAAAGPASLPTSPTTSPPPACRAGTTPGGTMNAAVLTVAGNAVDTPTLRFTSTGTPVANLRIASTERRQQDGHWTDGPTTYLTVTVGQTMAENTAESVRKGDRVLLHGRLVQNDYETRDGDKRTSYEIVADEIAISLRHATVTSTRSGAASDTRTGLRQRQHRLSRGRSCGRLQQPPAARQLQTRGATEYATLSLHKNVPLSLRD